MSNSRSSLVEFGKYRLDLEKKLLWADNETVEGLPPKAVELLCVLAERSGSVVGKEEIWQKVWDDAFVEETNLTHNVYLLRKFFREAGDGDVIKTVPRRGYQFVGERRSGSPEGFVIERQTVTRTLLEELPDTGRGQLSPSTNSEPSRRSIWLIIPFVLLAAAAAASYLYFVRPDPPEIKSLAVLPLRSFSPDIEDEPLRLRITDALTTKLGSLDQLAVRPTSSVLRFAGQDAIAAGKELNVEAVIDGSIQSEGGRIRITLQLISVAENRQLWSGQFDGSSGEMLALQDATADRLRNVLRYEVNDRFLRPPTRSGPAFEAYTKGRYLWNLRTPEAYWKALEYFQQSVELDPSFALGFAGIADCYYLLNQRDVLPAPQALSRAEEAARKAVSLDPDSAEALTSLAIVLSFYREQRPEAESLIAKALRINPSYAEGHARLGLMATFDGNFERGLVHLNEAERLDPTSLNIPIYLGMNYYFSGKNEEAVRQFEKILAFAPETPSVHFHLSRIYEITGQYDKAVASTIRERTVRSPTSHIEKLEKEYETRGIRAFWQAQIELFREESAVNSNAEYHIATRYALLRNYEAAINVLERNSSSIGGMWYGIRSDPLLAVVRADPRIKKLIE